MKPLATPDNVVEDQRRRAAHRHGLCFYITSYGVIQPEACTRDKREATGEEQELWQALVGEIKGVLTPDDREFDHSLVGRAPIYINTHDSNFLYRHPDYCKDLDGLYPRCFGTLHGTPVYISGAVPEGL